MLGNLCQQMEKLDNLGQQMEMLDNLNQQVEVYSRMAVEGHEEGGVLFGNGHSGELLQLCGG